MDKGSETLIIFIIVALLVLSLPPLSSFSSEKKEQGTSSIIQEITIAKESLEDANSHLLKLEELLQNQTNLNKEQGDEK